MFKRRLGYYLFHTYVPTCLIVIMSWISFWIKPEAVPARVTLGVTSLLTLSTQHANSQKSLPPVSYIKVLISFYPQCTLSDFFIHLFNQMSKFIQTKTFGIIWVQISISDVSINVYNGMILNNKHKEQMNFSLQLQR